MAIYGRFVHFVRLTMRKQENKPKWREPPRQRPTKILSPQGQAQHEISAKTAYVCKLTQLENSLHFCLSQEITPRRNQAPKPN